MKFQRYMQVSSVYQNETDVPFIRFRGKWVKDAGFDIGTGIKVDVEPNRLTVTPCGPDHYKASKGSCDLEQIVEESNPQRLQSYL